MSVIPPPQPSSTQTNIAPRPDVLLQVEKITKIFGSLKANDQVSLTIEQGEIHALLGENGAGKSTLVKMLFGSLQPNDGEIYWRGKKVTIPNPFAARALGIGMVFQHFSLFDALSVAENIALSLGSENRIGEIAQKAAALGEKYGLSLSPEALVGDLSVGERQRVEIIRCLLQNPQLIILDEPTSVLTPQEADRLFETLETLRAEGRSILYISHRLEEVKRMCDRATIMRHGVVVDECDPKQQTAATLAAKMVGESIHVVERRARPAEENAKAVLKVENLSQPAANPFAVALKDINLSVRPGKILGVAGVAGNGQSELFEALSGERLQTAPQMIEIRGTAVGALGINARRKLGAAFAPEERLGHGAIASLSLTDNLLLSRHASDKSAYLSGQKLGIIRRSALDRALARIVKDMDVRKSGTNPAAGNLSGGNLQKVVLGREFDRQPSLLVFNQPTWGVDAGAAARIRQKILDAVDKDAAALIISQDLDELFEICDEIAVMHDGRLSKAHDAAAVTRESIGLLMGGAQESQIAKEDA